MIRTLAAVLLIASASGAVGQEDWPPSSGVWSGPITPALLRALNGSEEPQVSTSSPDLDRAKAICDRHGGAEAALRKQFLAQDDASVPGDDWQPGWESCHAVQARWDDTAAAKAAAAAAEQDRQDHALVDRVAAGK